MSERVNLLITRFERLNTELVDFVAGLSDEQLRSPCADQGGATVGAVIAHLGEGAPEVLGWLVGAVGVEPRTDHLHGHEHGHGHGHGHEHGAAHVDRDDLADALRESLAAVVDVLRIVDDEQLDAIAPSAPGITDGTRPLAVVINTLIDHQLQHLGQMRRSVSAAEAGAVRGSAR